MTPALVQDYSQLLSVERTKLNDMIVREFAKASSTLSSKGVLQSSMGMRAIVDVATGRIPVFAQVCLNLMIRCSNSHGIAITTENRQDFLATMKGSIDEEVSFLRNQVAGSPSFRSTAATGHISGTMIAELDRSSSLELDRLDGELKLLAAANGRKSEKGDGSQMIFNAPVGLVQTGASSIGIATQHIDAGAKEALTDAMTKLIDTLKEAQAKDIPFDRGEVIELAREAHTEVAKPNPNVTRIRSLVGGIGAAIANAPKLKAAYDTVKWAGVFVGVHLP
ncbi:hypothetical protein NKH47_01675 [Mesorhizobium sp. M1060]|uniref:hypothetical protein n=1 Tax=Mesorhizobium sp. M1060 TaxID=2957052 RepID=UPI0033359D4A